MIGKIAVWLLLSASLAAAEAPSAPSYEVRDLQGWAVHVRSELLTPEKKTLTEARLSLVAQQLVEIVRVVPAAAVTELRKIPLWISPPYPKIPQRAEYHPGADWLKKNGRDPAMAKGVEFTNFDILDKEVLRMPMLALHELAHGYHDRVLGGNQPDIKACFARAVANKSYDKVSRKNWQGKITPNVKAYAMTNPHEFFAETSEAFFGENDMFPFNRKELVQHDPETVTMLKKVWHGE